jgi:hypothetical protein
MNHYQHFTYGDRWTSTELDQAVQIARVLEARDAARQALDDCHREQRRTNLLFGWALIAFVTLFAASPFICWWVL